jgi:hypothetical protein
MTAFQLALPGNTPRNKLRTRSPEKSLGVRHPLPPRLSFFSWKVWELGLGCGGFVIKCLPFIAT